MTAQQSIAKLHKKYYGPGTKAAKKEAKKQAEIDKVNAVIAKKKEAPAVVEGRGPEFDARVAADAKKSKDLSVPKPQGIGILKAQAKEKGIKYFQILHRDELQEILAGAAPERVAELQAVAKARWQSGWGNKKKPVVA